MMSLITFGNHKLHIKGAVHCVEITIYRIPHVSLLIIPLSSMVTEPLHEETLVQGSVLLPPFNFHISSLCQKCVQQFIS